MIFFELFYTFFFIGMFTIGGGYAMLTLIQHQVVTVHGWISAEAFTDIIAISQMTPGPIGINSATYIGYSVIQAMGYSPALCVAGSFLATSAVVLPSFLITYWICRLYARLKSNPVFAGVLQSFKPLVIGLLAAATLVLITPQTFPDYISWIIFAAAFAITMWAKASPILTIVLAGIAGYLIYA
ncbi:MAG: chromate transporter [Bacteroidales bacterium]|nr:chromate transporter [Bacteroidales bacterium]